MQIEIRISSSSFAAGQQETSRRSEPVRAGHLIRKATLDAAANSLPRDASPAFPPLLSDVEVADTLVMTTDWVRAHSNEIPGFERLGSYFRFRSQSVEQWLGSLDRLLVADQIAALLKVPTSWVYANADQIPGVLRLGLYIRFRPSTIKLFLGGSTVAQ